MEKGEEDTEGGFSRAIACCAKPRGASCAKPRSSLLRGSGLDAAAA